MGVIGNCTTLAVVDRFGSIVQYCHGRFDRPPVFYGLVDSPNGIDEAGGFHINLEDFAGSRQEYIYKTAVLRTTMWDIHGNVLQIDDHMPRYRDGQNFKRKFRPSRIVRRVTPKKGNPRIRVVVQPRFKWGKEIPVVEAGTNHLSFRGTGGKALRLTASVPIDFVAYKSEGDGAEDDGTEGYGTPFLLQETLSMVFGPDEPLTGNIDKVAEESQDLTEAYWLDWVGRLSKPAWYQKQVIRAAISGKLLTHESTGGIVAAATTSIPEAPYTERNWDYRCACWVRDGWFIATSLASLSATGALEGFQSWLRNLVANSQGRGLQPLYGLGLEATLTERIIENLRGFRGMLPVRDGNDAYRQRQSDGPGQMVVAAARSFLDEGLHRQGTLADFEMLQRLGELAWDIHDKPDAGIWELRGSEHVHTSSVLMNWAACDRLAKIAAALKRSDDVTAEQRVWLTVRQRVWRNRANRIRTTILEKAWNPKKKAFTAYFGGDTLDASVLLMARIGILDSTDEGDLMYERFVQTVKAMEKPGALVKKGGFVLRYEGEDDFGHAEVSFNICAFWYVEALALIGQLGKARRLFKQLLGYANPLGLWSEDTHPGQVPPEDRMWGNFHQGYSYCGVIDCAWALSPPWSKVG